MVDLWDNLQQLLECPSAERLRVQASQQVQRLGFDKWIYTDGTPGRGTPVSLVAYPPDWMSHYRRQGYLDVDPVIEHCRQRSTPCLWASNPAARRVGFMTRFFSEAADFGLHAGIGLPTHGPGGHSGMLSVATGDITDVAGQLRQIGELQLLASFIHEAQLKLTSEAAQAQVHLTARELDCLRWAAEGKTSWEIGQQLGISERTAIFHLNNSARKLGVMGRRQAIARAMSLQLIAL
jgi:DNA-binding CsgD family transcriptional regulator